MNLICYFLFGLTFFSGKVLLASPVADLPGVVPIEDIRPPATDLVYQGEILLPYQAKQLKNTGVDLSTIDPDPTSEQWKNHEGFIQGQDGQLEIFDNDEVEFISSVTTPIKGYRFTVQKMVNGRPVVYTIMVHKRAHTFLLRKALLRKLGYQIPPTKHLKKLRVHFSGVFSKNQFLGKKNDSKDEGEPCNPEEQECDASEGGLGISAGGIDRWVTNLDDEDTTFVDLQDMIVTEGDNHIYNLAMAPGDALTMRGRRIFNALLVPFNLVDVQESVNGLYYYSSRRWNNTIYFPLEDVQEFTTTWDDARWIARRISRLGRSDFEAIVAEAQYPDLAAKLLVEKLISRRNEMLKILELPYEEIPFNAKLNFPPDLVDGRLTKKSWEGYGSNFSYGEEESPISGPEIRAYLKSKLISTTIDELVRKVNLDLMPKTDIEQLVMEKQREIALQRIINYFETGKNENVPFGIWTAPIYSGQLLMSREVVAGSYMGADNTIQLADSLGFSVDAGLYIGTQGLRPEFFVDGQAKVFWTRNYTHLKPLLSIKMANKEPFKNMLVPLIKKQIGHVLDEVSRDSFESLTESEKQAKVSAMVGLFKDHLGDGESLMITDSVGGQIGIRAAYRFSERLKAQLSVSDKQMIVSRLHIMRRGHQIHVYKDLGNVNVFKVSISLQAKIQLLELGAQYTFGTARVKYFNLDINPDFEKNPLVVDNLKSLRELFDTNSTRNLSEKISPYIFEHDISEKARDFRFLIWASSSVESKDAIKMMFPNNERDPRYFIRSTDGKRTGKDYQFLTVDLVNFLLAEWADFEGAFSNRNNGNPGDTLYGQSETRNIIFEGEYYKDSKASGYPDPFLSAQYTWKGWEAKRSKILDLLMSLNSKYKSPLFSQRDMSLTKHIQLYMIGLNLNLYKDGIHYMFSLPETQVDDIFLKYWAHHNAPQKISKAIAGSSNSRFYKKLKWFKIYQKRYLKAIKEGKLSSASEQAVRIFNLAETNLTFAGLQAATNNGIYLSGSIRGFKQGEDGKSANSEIISSDIGEFGSAQYDGPLRRIQRSIGIAESEFYVNWLLRKL